jgi:hypothetical protein
MAILDHTGHTVVEWDTEEELSVKRAEREFHQQISDGNAIFLETSDGTRQTDHFDKNLDQIALPPKAGG